MNSKKRLGKGLEDISHLFLSGVSSASSPTRTTETERIPDCKSAPSTRVWLTASLIPEWPSAFFTGNLAVELARCGRRVLTVETAPTPSLNDVLGTGPIRPSLCDLLEQPLKQVTIEGPPGIKILSFRFCPEEFAAFSADERDVLYQILRKEEEASEWVWINAVYQEDPSFETLLRLVQGVVLAADLNAKTILQIYRACKYLYHIHPDLRIGLILFGERDDASAAAGMGKLSDAVARFLGKSLEWHGTIRNDPLIQRSLTAKIPVTLLDPGSNASSDFTRAAMNLRQETGAGPVGSLPGDSFFSRFQSTASLVEG